MTTIGLHELSKRFDRTVAVRDINLRIEAGELFFLLGPSGCGKSTLLRMIAGLIEPTAGRIVFNDRDVTNLGTEQRNAVMCFQSYALWPHMTVQQNVAFGLDVRGMDRAAQKHRIEEVLRMVQLSELAARKPNQLSGGQQQRVALARALAVRPDCLLLDEPLSNLDAQLRQEMRGEIRRICKSSGLTTIYVTHDQREALSVADRIGIMRNGVLEQVGTPTDLYHRPANSFVAGFIGQTNLIAGRVIKQEQDRATIRTALGEVVGVCAAQLGDKEVLVSIRPEQLRLTKSDTEATASPQVNRLRGRLMQSTFLGDSSEYVVAVDGQSLKISSAGPMRDWAEDVAVEFDPADALVLEH
ncbi:MAG: ABC transporter ATP-binding protein [Phycisphaerales bacterium]|jgi:iron(III) transport system ATP-binding protein|nr:ABC transporter ATP-binding protein [Phycisphaerales bacterium]